MDWRNPGGSAARPDDQGFIAVRVQHEQACAPHGQRVPRSRDRDAERRPGHEQRGLVRLDGREAPELRGIEFPAGVGLHDDGPLARSEPGGEQFGRRGQRVQTWGGIGRHHSLQGSHQGRVHIRQRTQLVEPLYRVVGLRGDACGWRQAGAALRCARCLHLHQLIAEALGPRGLDAQFQQQAHEIPGAEQRNGHAAILVLDREDGARGLEGLADEIPGRGEWIDGNAARDSHGTRWSRRAGLNPVVGEHPEQQCSLARLRGEIRNTALLERPCEANLLACREPDREGKQTEHARDQQRLDQGDAALASGTRNHGRHSSPT